MRAALVFSSAVVNSVSCIHAGDTISLSEFLSFKEPEQIAYLRESILVYRKLTSNLSATAVMTLQNMSFDSVLWKKGSDVHFVGTGYEFDVRRIDFSYRTRSIPIPHKPKPNVGYATCIEGFDAISGRRVQHDLVEKDEREVLSTAVIKPTRGSVSRSCFLYQYIGDSPSGSGAFDVWNPAGHFLQNSDRAKIKGVRGLGSIVEVEFPSLTPWLTESICTVMFDPSMDFVIAGMKMIEISKSGHDSEEFHNLLTMSSFENVKDTWIPTEFELIAWSTNSSAKATVYHGNVSDIRIGELTLADLEVDIPPGTTVSDMISGTSYYIMPDGLPSEPISFEKIAKSRSAKEISRSNVSGKSSTLFLVAIAGFFVALVTLPFLSRKFKKRRSPVGPTTFSEQNDPRPIA